MMATRTLPLDSDIGASELLSDVEDALENRDPGGRGEHDDRPLETAPGSEDEPRGDDEHGRAEPVEEELVAVLERDEHRGNEAERDAGGGERVGRDPGAREAAHRAAGEGARARGVALLDAARSGFQSQTCYGPTIAG